MTITTTAVELELDGVDAGYRGRPILRSASLRLGAREIVALIGPNGSGKSTTLRVASGALAPTAGSALLGGIDVAALSARERARRIAMLPQSPPIAEGLTVRELVEHGRHAHRGLFARRAQEDADAVADALRWTSLESLAARRVEALSGGERQRAWIAMTLAQRAPLLLLDEPTTFLDVGHQLELLELLERLRDEQGLGVLVVLHDLAQAAAFADRLVVVDRGRVVASGSPADALTSTLLEERFGVRCELAPLARGRLRVTPTAATTRAAAEGGGR